MTALQADLFGHVHAPATKPDGFDYWPDVLPAAEQFELAALLHGMDFKPYEHMGYQGFRRIVAFGQRFDMERNRMEVADPLPDFLQLLRARLAERVGLNPDDFVQALINEYAPGAGIGWHRDRPVYGEILGVSLLTPCVMRLRQKDGAGWRRSAARLEPGSAYRLSGNARREWEHSIAPMTALRYSITFRTLA